MEILVVFLIDFQATSATVVDIVGALASTFSMREPGCLNTTLPSTLATSGSTPQIMHVREVGLRGRRHSSRAHQRNRSIDDC